jgi:hypothetical protein
MKESKERLNDCIKREEKLSELYAKELLSIEAYKNQHIPLKSEIEQLKMQIAGYELQLAQKERSEEYKHLLKLVTDRELFTKKSNELNTDDIKLMLKFMFKNIIVEDGNIKEFELYEPFYAAYLGDEIVCETQENQQLTLKDPYVIPYERTAAK